MNSDNTTVPTAAQISSSGSPSRRSDPRGPVPALSPSAGERSPTGPSTSAVGLKDFRSLIRLALDQGVPAAHLAALIAGDAS